MIRTKTIINLYQETGTLLKSSYNARHRRPRWRFSIKNDHGDNAICTCHLLYHTCWRRRDTCITRKFNWFNSITVCILEVHVCDSITPIPEPMLTFRWARMWESTPFQVCTSHTFDFEWMLWMLKMLVGVTQFWISQLPTTNSQQTCLGRDYKKTETVSIKKRYLYASNCPERWPSRSNAKICWLHTRICYELGKFSPKLLQLQ